MKSNKKLGNDFEQEVCQILAEAGYWVHNFANRANGQPMDIIATKENTVCLIDAKVCSQGFFETRRLEENQILTMRKWFACGNTDAFLFFLLPDKSIYSVWIPGDLVLDKILSVKRIPEETIRKQYCWKEGEHNGTE